MVRRLCIVQGCVQDVEDETDYESLDQAIRVMEMHMRSHELLNAAPVLNQPGVAHAQNQSRIPKSNLPTVEMGILNQEWEYFMGDWRRHVDYCGLTDQRDLIHNLWVCLSPELK